MITVAVCCYYSRVADVAITVVLLLLLLQSFC